jgi:hypothetical protein
MSITPATSSDRPIWDVWLSAFHAPALAICDELGVFSALADHPARPAELATVLQVELRAAETLAGLMAALGFLAQADGRFHLTDVAREYLLPGSPYYWGGLLRRIRDNPLDCNKLVAALRGGTTARDAGVSGQIWRAPVPSPQALEGFTHAMHAHSFALAMRVIPRFGLAGVARLLDVGAGSGSYSIAAVLRHPELRSVLVDLPAVCGVAASYAASYGVRDRIDTVPIDMFTESWPAGFDRVLFSDVFHDWDDEVCRLLAERAHDALVPGGQVLVHEMLASDGKDAPLAALGYSMVMLFVTEGRQRTASETLAVLTGAGFVDPRVTMTSNGYALISATRA